MEIVSKCDRLIFPYFLGRVYAPNGETTLLNRLSIDIIHSKSIPVTSFKVEIEDANGASSIMDLVYFGLPYNFMVDVLADEGTYN